MTLGTTTAQGNVVLQAATDLVSKTLTSTAGAVTANSGQSMTLGTTTAQGNVVLQAATDLVSTTLTSTAGAVTANSGQSMTLGATTAQGNVVLDATTKLTATSLTSIGGAISATSGQTMVLGMASSLTDLSVDAGTGLIATALSSSAGSIAAGARVGDVVIQTVDATVNGKVTAPAGQARVDAIRVGTDFTLIGFNDLSVRSGTAGRNFTLASTGGSVTAGSLAARSVVLIAPKQVTVGSVTVADSFLFGGNNVFANVYASGGPLTGNVTGFNGAIANNVALTLYSPGGTSMGNLRTRTANVQVLAGPLAIANVEVVDRATLSNANTRVVVDQHDRSTQTGADVQLYSAGAPFSFSMFDNHVLTNAYVPYRNAGFDSLATSGLNLSAGEAGELALSMARNPLPTTSEQNAGTAKTPVVVTFTGFPVSLEEK